MGRKDGRRIKGINGFTRIAAQMLGNTRVETTNLYTQEVITKPMDEYIAKKSKEDGVEYTYRDIAIATLVRVFYLRPHLNRFVYRGNFYQRNYIDIAIVMHKNLRTGEQETVVKCRFTGKETLREVKQILDTTIIRAMTETVETDEFVNKIGSKLPTWLLRCAMSMMRWADRWGLLSDNFMFTVSPFHTSVLFADMKSVHLGPVWHHMYNFGNCGFMACMGKEKKKAIVDVKTNTIQPTQVLELGISMDERFIDGLTYSHVIKTIERAVANLTVLERAPEEDERKWPWGTPTEMKQREKWKKQDARKAAKLAKKVKK